MSETEKSSKKKPVTPPPANPAEPTWDERVINQVLPWRVEFLGAFVALVGLIIFLSLFQSSTQVHWLRILAGWGSFVLAFSLLILGLYIALRRFVARFRPQASQVMGGELILLVLLALTHSFLEAGLPEAFLGQGGGLVGWALSEPLLDFFGPVLTYSCYLFLLGWGVALVRRLGWRDFLQGLRAVSVKLQNWGHQLEATAKPGVFTSHPMVEMPAQSATSSTSVNGLLPPLSLLQEGEVVEISAEELEEKKQKIIQTLNEFGLPAEIASVRSGPAITQFGVKPGFISRVGSDGQPYQQKVRVSQIATLNRDLALALRVTRLRVEAPVLGHHYVGIEVPNEQLNGVRIRPLLEEPLFQKVKSPLALALGRDVSGMSVITDLAKLPHLLIAGTTGSGKSVCLNSFITTLVVNNLPEQLRLVLIDPKKVELIRFNGLPHLLGPAETNHERVIGVLRWLTAEMDQRYQLFSQLGARNLTVYNEIVRHKKDGKPLPYIAVFIDELADLMAVYPSDVERTLCRLAQMARATGIHLVVATQRPSIDVITGLIKANFPARIAFAVASAIDSRVILDTVGAEQLLGRGDMLFLAPDASSPKRIQGCWVDDEEIDRVVEHWQKVLPEWNAGTPPWEATLVRMNVVEQTDDLLEKAITLAQEQETLSISLLQRKLRIGYPRAARLMETLYEKGIVDDPQQGSKVDHSSSAP